MLFTNMLAAKWTNQPPCLTCMGGWLTPEGLMIPTGKGKIRDSVIINTKGVAIRSVTPQEAAVIRAHSTIEIWQITNTLQV